MDLNKTQRIYKSKKTLFKCKHSPEGNNHITCDLCWEEVWGSKHKKDLRNLKS